MSKGKSPAASRMRREFFGAPLSSLGLKASAICGAMRGFAKGAGGVPGLSALGKAQAWESNEPKARREKAVHKARGLFMAAKTIAELVANFGPKTS